ncbi:MAG: SDR family oxidoreductase, partial [Pseudomonadota bacterium]
MKVIIFGATGSVGRLVVEQTLSAGHHATAFARKPQKLDINHPNLSLAAGNALDADDVSKAMPGHDAAIVVLGAGMDRKSRIRSQGTLNVINAMQDHGVKRLIAQSTLGAHESWSNLNFFWKRIMFGGIIKPVFKDHELQEQMVRASGLDWTIVRPGAFDEGPATGTYKAPVLPGDRKLTLKISRADIADFIGKELVNATYLRRATAQ